MGDERKTVRSKIMSTNVDMSGRIVVITGATSGLGKESALRIAQMGATVALVGRSQNKLEKTVDEIKSVCPGAKLETFQCDLSLLAQTRNLATQLLAKFPKIDVLMNNAGISTQKMEITSEGFEHVFSTNHLSGFLLTNLLLERLILSKARIVNISSFMHKHVGIDFDNLQTTKGFNWDKAYSRTKLYNLMFTYELARKLAGTWVTVNAVNPGMVKTGIGGDGTKLLRFGKFFYDLFSYTVEKGARTQIFVATSPTLAGVSGQYFSKCRLDKSTKISRNQIHWARLWDESARMCGLM